MLKGLAITPPVVGRISIGRIVERNGKRLPERDDAFTLTTQVQQRGEWLLHPMQEVLRKATPGKLRSIPVRMLFADPDLNLRADFSLFDRDTGRPVCVGDGETCRRIGKDGNGIETLPCPSPDGCGFGQQGGCKPYARLNVLIGDEDELGSFVLRTTSFNSIRTLAARLHYFRAISGNLLPCLPLELRLRGKSTTQSYRAPIYYVDLTVRSGSTLEEALTQAHELDARRKLAGFDQAALDDAARLGFANGAFEDSPEERAAVAEEFYPAAEAAQSNGDPTSSDPGSAAKSSLREKLDRQAAFLGGAAA
ncbi:putative hydrolase/metal-binding protein [Burkholderia pseudomallei]|uniref:recombination directionality factor n=1 Tax=Burkholderia pseudomallei TaxID=28450 RepID=UPI0009784128|nr:phage capsid protein [Burkholderia pseudomallei]AYX34638.1 phage capsid protein [Burkholderia pseudomallei]OMT50705.1 phage capsid protein [Burkholderia pseudomallei]OMT57998.1 phage capsid protein [Burkholderia pseudomallei]ONE03102.1 phage capsid protein [Burkholderia pseudomallei]ONE09642.1 phage capsid protein [Burkholderia pseudomallei]